MLIVCPTCASEYRVDAARLGSEGRRVRCQACQSAWFVSPEPEPEPSSPPEPEPEPEAADPLGGLSAAEFVEREWQLAADSGEVEIPADVAPAEAEPPAPAMVEPAPPPERKAEARKLNVKPRRDRNEALFIAAVGLIFLVLGVWQRNIVVRWAPSLAGPLEKIGLKVNTRGLVFEDVASELVVDPSGRFLVVRGNVVNITNRPVVLPMIEAVVRDGAQHRVYTWTAEPSRPVLPPGEALPFRTRLAAPPAAGRDVQLRFVGASAVVAASKN